MQTRIAVFQGKPGLLRLAPSWRSLTARLENRRHFHCVEWYLALAESFEERLTASNLYFFGVFSSDELLAVFPFRLILIDVAGIELHALQLPSDSWEAETARDFIAAPSLADGGYLENVVRFLDQEPSWDVISLRGILDDSFAARALRSSSNLHTIGTPGGLWGKIEFLSCERGDQEFDRLSKGFRQNLRTAHNKLKSKKVDFVSARNPDDLLALYPDLLKVESSGWKGAQGTSVLKQPVVDSFLRHLISNFGPIGGCEIHIMKIEARPVAVLFCIVVNNICYILKTGYDEAFSNLSPGHLIVEYLIKTRGATGTLNIVTPYNAPPWFNAWKPNTVMGIYNAYIFRPSQRGEELARRIDSAFKSAIAKKA
jgi:hypothetical protein